MPRVPASERAANTWVARALLGTSAALHLYFGGYFAIDAAPMLEGLAIAATEPAGLIEMRAFYGGLMLALGALFAAALRRAWLYPGLVLMTVTYFGAATVRATWIALDGVADAWLLRILAIEGLGALAGAGCLLRGGLPRSG